MDFARPTTVDEALASFRAQPGASYLAGGQTLVGLLRLGLAKPSRLVDVSRIDELLVWRDEPDQLVVGAAITHSQLAAKATIPALASLAAGIGDLQIRNMGTIGGGLANNDPAGDYPAAILGLGARIQTDRRILMAEEFLTGPFQTALEPGELIVSVSFPRPIRAGYAKIRNPSTGYAIVGVFAALTNEGTRVAVTGAGPYAFRISEFEQLLDRDFTPDAIKGLSVPQTELRRDLHATPEYRAHLIGVLAGRAVMDAR